MKVTAKYFFIFLIIFYGVIALVFANPKSAAGSPRETAPAQKYSFTEDWTTRNTPTWDKALLRYKGKPDIHYLEIGVFEGRTLFWMLENILTHSTAKATCIDIFTGNYEKKFLGNLNISGFTDKVIVIKEMSQTALRNLPLNSFDIIYIDGDHAAAGVLADAVLSWSLLKAGGILIFDDYGWSADIPMDLKPRLAIDTFITSYGDFIEILEQNYQVILRKRKAFYRCPRCSAFGQYLFSWDQEELYRKGTAEPIEISNEEKDLIEELIKSRKFGQSGYSIEGKISKDKTFVNLKERLKLDFGNEREE